jgi:uncharacterized membrane protein
MTDITTSKEAQHLHRLILFSDAVFAIAITLLAIEIHPPEHFASVADFFQQMHDKLLSYAFSFGVVGIYWISHRRLFNRLTKADTVLDVLNFVMLGLVALLPLGTQLLWESGAGPAIMIYVGLVTAIGLALALSWGYGAFIGGLVEPMSRLEKIYILLRVALLPGLMCGLSFLSLVTHKPWGFVAMGGVVIGLTLISRAMRKSQAA